MITTANQLPSESLHASDTSSSDRARFVRSELVKRAKSLQENQFQIIELLIECHDQEYWRADFKCFTDYMAEEVNLSQRTAQEYLRVGRICKDKGCH